MFFAVLSLIGLDVAGKLLNTKSGKNESDEYGMYKDRNGNYRLKQNGHWVIDTYNDYGERIIKNVKSGSTEVNIDKIAREKRKEEAIKNGDDFYLYLSERNNSGQKHRWGNDNIIGDRYKRTDNDISFYVIKTITYSNNDLNENPPTRSYYGKYYMDMNYNICFPTEETKKKDKENYGDRYDVINDFILNESNKYINSLKRGISGTSTLNDNCYIKLLSNKDSWEELKNSNQKWRRTHRK